MKRILIAAAAFTLAACNTTLPEGPAADAGAVDAGEISPTDAGPASPATVDVHAGLAKQGCFAPPCPTDTLPEFTPYLDAYTIELAQGDSPATQADAEAACVARGGHLPTEAQYERALELRKIDIVPEGAGEWTRDWYDPTYYQNPALTDPTGPNSGTIHTVRGGTPNWFDRIQPASDTIPLPFRCTYGW